VNGNVVPSLGSDDHLDRIRRKAIEKRIPLHGTIDLTYRCNLNCVHCYVGPHGGPSAGSGIEMATSEVLDLLDQVAGAGCLYLLFSGGEPLLREDFPEIYRHARDLGMWVTVFTNATLLRKEHLDLFSDYPPYLVEVTLYGATLATWEAVTGVPGSFARTMKNVRTLIDLGIRLTLKTVILQTNVDEVPDIEAVARGFGTPFRIDGTIVPRLDGNKGPLRERVTPERVVALEFADGGRLAQYRDFYNRMCDLPVQAGPYQCAAGTIFFHISPEGLLRPCLMITDLVFDALAMGFAGAWRAATAGISAKPIDAGQTCRSCERRLVCGYCPGLASLEGRNDGPLAYLCKLGTLRMDYIHGTHHQGGMKHVV
jgi:radical SAM protein with 4Fe4S-binding SPASM domain